MPIHAQIVKRSHRKLLASRELNQASLQPLQFIIHNKSQYSIRQYHNQHQVRTNNPVSIPTFEPPTSKRVSIPAIVHRPFSQSATPRFNPSNQNNNNNNNNNDNSPKDIPITPEIIKAAQIQPIPHRLHPSMRHYIQPPDSNGEYTFRPQPLRPLPPQPSPQFPSSYSANPLYRISKSITKRIVQLTNRREPADPQSIRSTVRAWIQFLQTLSITLLVYFTFTVFKRLRKNEKEDGDGDANAEVQVEGRVGGQKRKRGEMPDDEVTRRMVRGEVTRIEGVLPLDEVERREVERERRKETGGW